MLFRRSLKLGRLFGIQIELDWSLVFIFGLIVVSLGSGVFPNWHPDWSPSLVWGMAFGAAVLFFLSILAHEMSHALVARAYGIPVDSITLFLFGGMANIENDPDTPLKEALMAVAGPVMSIALGFGFLFLAGITTSVSLSEDPVNAFAQMSPLTTLLAWLGPVNIILGVFNMLPGFPLDGGRVLRAILWGVTKDLNKATRWASRAGQVVGYGFVAMGLLMAFGVYIPVFGTGFINGLWLVFIGWFLSTAAAAAYQQLRVRQSLEGVAVRRLISDGLPPTVNADHSVAHVAEHFMKHGDEPVLSVMEGELITGVISADEIRRVPRRAWEDARVRDIMARFGDENPLSPDDDAYAAMRRLLKNRGKPLPVVESGELVGLFGMRQIGRWLSLQPGETGRIVSGWQEGGASKPTGA